MGNRRKSVFSHDSSQTSVKKGFLDLSKNINVHVIPSETTEKVGHRFIHNGNDLHLCTMSTIFSLHNITN